MIKVIEIDLEGVHFPRGGVGMVVAQPFIEFTKHEPITCVPARKDRTLADIEATLQVARERHHRREKTHFTIFPECSLPGLEGVARVTSAMSADSWPAGTVVIAGVDGLESDAYTELLQGAHVHHDPEVNAPSEVRPEEWVNCSITWTKLGNGEVHLWVQPKLDPAWVEVTRQHQSMFRGRSLYVFKGTYEGTRLPFRFSTLLCYDWIGERNGRRMWQWLLQSIDETAAGMGATLPFTWLFVAQCNSDPSHASFMQQVAPFFDTAHYPNVSRDDACVIMANVAGRETPGKCAAYGNSAVISPGTKFLKPDGMLSYCSGGAPLREGNPLENFRDALFRERGACIHSFHVKNSGALPPGSAGRSYALEQATVHPLSGCVDPRVPSAGVPASVKWMNDDLDDVAKSLRKRFPYAGLSEVAQAAQDALTAQLRSMPSTSLTRTVLVANSETPTKASPDRWGERESSAVEHLLHTLSILQVGGYRPQLHATSAHATVTRADACIEVVAVRGDSHEACELHIQNQGIAHRGPLLVVSRDEHNTQWDKRFGSFLGNRGKPTKEADITDPMSAVVRVGYQNILHAFLVAMDPIEIEDVINGAFD